MLDKKTVLPALLITGLLLSACGDAVNRANYERIETGMSQEQVFAVLGEPDEFNSIELGELSGATARWTGRKQTINVTFTNEKVAFKRIGESSEATR